MDAEYRNEFFVGGNDRTHGQALGEDAWRFRCHRELMCPVPVDFGIEKRVAVAGCVFVMWIETGERWMGLCCQSCEIGLRYSDLDSSSHRKKYCLWV